MLPPAPERFSTTTGDPKSACICCCRIRASRSAEPPAWNGTTIVTGRCGQASSARAAAVFASMTPTTTAVKTLIIPPILARWASAQHKSSFFLCSRLRAWSHRLRVERPVAQFQICLKPPLALRLEQTLTLFAVGGMRQPAQGAFQQQRRMNARGLDTLHGYGFVEPNRRLGNERDAFGERASARHQLIVRHYLVDHANAQRLLGVEMIAGKRPAVGRFPTA